MQQLSWGEEEIDPKVPGWKRLLDITCVVTAMPILLPTIISIALLIKCTSGSPVLFIQERIGLGGRRFNCIKFRTMHINADEEDHRRYLTELIQLDRPTAKMDVRRDPRVIPCGRFLRVIGMDELPQILNVLMGQMSLVGPRPCLPYEYEDYEPAQKERFETLPGLTGLWQISRKNRTTYSEMIALDIEYSRNKSLWLDIKILLKTIPAVVSHVRDMRALRQSL